MEAGQLKRPIAIESPSTTQDSFGQPTDTWNTVCSTWSAITAVTSKEVYALGAGFTAQVSHKVTIRYNESLCIEAGFRILYRDRIFLVQTVSDPDEQRVQLNLMCLELSK
jgi:SPP1 family predicted phage head-tail adaptor